MLASCATPTKVTQVWRDENYRGGNLKKILVIGASERPAMKRLFEEEFLRGLKERGISAVPGYALFPEDRTPKREEIAAKVKEQGIDGLFIVKLKYREGIGEYKPGKRTELPEDYYEDIQKYTGRSFGYEPSPDMPQRGPLKELVHLETNLYDGRTEKLVWSAASETVLEGSLDKSVASYVKVMIETLVKEKLIP